MKKILFFLVLFFLSSISFADEYVLVMSKDDNVCQHMLKLYNEDLRKYGEIKYDQHEEFNAIKWEEKKYYMMREGKKEYPPSYASNMPALMSRFDINNDGKEEVVIKTEGMLHGIVTEQLFYFRGKDSAYFNNEEGFDTKILYDKATGRVGGGVGFEANGYGLKELPKISIGVVGDKEAYAHYVVGGHFYIDPFIFNGTYYIDMKDKQLGIRKWLVILKYTKDNQIKDVCYCLEALDCNNKKKRGE